MSEYRLTIAVCCHADTPYFEEMMDSFIHAGIVWPKTEFLVCDDGSPYGGDGDKARRIAERSDLPFTMNVIRHDSHWRQAASKQHLRDLAKGEYILFFDSDDVFVPFNVIANLDFLDAHPEYCGTYGKKICFDAENGYHGCLQGGDYSAFEMLFTPPLAINGMIVRTSDLRESWGFILPDGTALNCGDDVCMWFGCGLKKDFYFTAEFRALYRNHSDQITHNAEEEYKRNYGIFHEQIKKIAHDLLDNMQNSLNFSFPIERQKEMMMLLGAEFAATNDLAAMYEFLRVAELVDPDDYGIREMRLRLLRQDKRYDDALLEAFLMAGEHPDSAYITQIAYNHVVEVLQELGRDAAPFRKLWDNAAQRHARLNDEQLALTNRTVENARRYLAYGHY